MCLQLNTYMFIIHKAPYARWFYLGRCKFFADTAQLKLGHLDIESNVDDYVWLCYAFAIYLTLFNPDYSLISKCAKLNWPQSRRKTMFLQLIMMLSAE